MGLWETLTGRTRAKQANLDALFLIPSAAITLQTAAGFMPTGLGSVCFRAATGLRINIPVFETGTCVSWRLSIFYSFSHPTFVRCL